MLSKFGGDYLVTKQEIIEENVRSILEMIGEDPERDGLKDTPYRVAKMCLNELFTGYAYSEDDVRNILQKQFDVDDGDGYYRYNGMVIVKDIDFVSMCEHHILPIIGKAHVVYIPDEKVVGLSKLARVVDVYARRLQVQERMTEQIAEAIWRYLKPQGVMVVVEAKHYCMVIRGVRKQNSVTVTSSIRGVFVDDQAAREEALKLIGRRCY